MALARFVKCTYGLYEVFKWLIRNFPIGFLITNPTSSSRWLYIV